jgi:hypothetical protein
VRLVPRSMPAGMRGRRDRGGRGGREIAYGSEPRETERAANGEDGGCLTESAAGHGGNLLAGLIVRNRT